MARKVLQKALHRVEVNIGEPLIIKASNAEHVPFPIPARESPPTMFAVSGIHKETVLDFLKVFSITGFEDYPKRTKRTFKLDGTSTTFEVKQHNFQLTEVSMSRGFRLALTDGLDGRSYDVPELLDQEIIRLLVNATVASAGSANATLAMLTILKVGGFTTVGLNFDAHIRRNSIEPADLFKAHIGGMDAFAKSKLSFQDLAALAKDYGNVGITSGKQEMLWNLVNQYLVGLWGL